MAELPVLSSTAVMLKSTDSDSKEVLMTTEKTTLGTAPSKEGGSSAVQDFGAVFWDPALASPAISFSNHNRTVRSSDNFVSNVALNHWFFLTDDGAEEDDEDEDDDLDGHSVMEESSSMAEESALSGRVNSADAATIAESAISGATPMSAARSATVGLSSLVSGALSADAAAIEISEEKEEEKKTDECRKKKSEMDEFVARELKRLGSEGDSDAPLRELPNNSAQSRQYALGTLTPAKSQRGGASSSKQHGGAEDEIVVIIRVDHTVKGYFFLGVVTGEAASVAASIGRASFLLGHNSHSWAWFGYDGCRYHDAEREEYLPSSLRWIKSDQRDSEDASGTSGSTRSGSSEDHRKGLGRTWDAMIAVRRECLDAKRERRQQRAKEAREKREDHFSSSALPSTTQPDWFDDSSSMDGESESQSAIISEAQMKDFFRRNLEAQNMLESRIRRRQAVAPIVRSGDRIKMRMSVNKQTDRIDVSFSLNSHRLGVAWKGLPRPLNVVLSLVGKGDTLTLESCNYKPVARDKNCVIL